MHVSRCIGINYEHSYRLQRHSEEILRLKMEEIDLMGEDNVADNFLKRLAVDMRSGEVCSLIFQFI